MTPASPRPSIQPRAESVAATRSRAELIALVDALINVYVSWRGECASVALSYSAWGLSDRRDKRVAFSAYVAALDREEAAAETYRNIVGRITQLQASLAAAVEQPGQATGSDAARAGPWSPQVIAQRLRQ
jgi:hypothetical protein